MIAAAAPGARRERATANLRPSSHPPPAGMSPWRRPALPEVERDRRRQLLRYPRHRKCERRCQQPFGRAGRRNGRLQRAELHYPVLRLRHRHQHRAEQHGRRARRLEWRHDRPIAGRRRDLWHFAELSRRTRGHQCRLDSRLVGGRSGQVPAGSQNFAGGVAGSEFRADRSHHIVGQRELGRQQRGRRPRGRQWRFQQLLGRAAAGIAFPVGTVSSDSIATGSASGGRAARSGRRSGRTIRPPACRPIRP